MQLSFLLDENMPYALMSFLEKRGHTVYHIRKLGKVGIRNGEVYQVAIELKSWILTKDKDFLSYIKFALHDVPGVIVLRSEEDLKRNEIVSVMRKFFDKYESQLTEKLLIKIEHDEVEILRAEE